MELTETTGNIIKKSDFAKMQGVNKSTVTRWGKAGRLVLAENGKVIRPKPSQNKRHHGW